MNRRVQDTKVAGITAAMIVAAITLAIAPAASAGEADAPCRRLHEFTSLHRPAINARVWWEKKRPDDKKPAAKLAGELERVIWPQLSKVMDGGPNMPSDQTGSRRASCTGRDAALDIYLTMRTDDCKLEDRSGRRDKCKLKSDEGVTTRLDESRSSRVDIHPQSGRDVLAHEVMHVLQNRFSISRRHSDEWHWVDDATATWAMAHLYPRSSIYPNAARLVRGADAPLAGEEHYNGWGYDGWALVYSMVRETGSPSIVHDVYANGRTLNGLAALDAALLARNPQGRGLRDAWSLFARQAWNRRLKPTALPESFRQWLGFKARPNVKPTPLKTGENRQEIDLQPFGKDYRRYVFDRDQKHIRFNDPSAGGRDLDAHAFIKLDGQWSHEDWTALAQRTFCRSGAERVDEVILVYTTASRRGIDTRDPEVRIKRRCPTPKPVRWTATFSASEHAEYGECNGTEWTVTDVTHTGYHSTAPFFIPSPDIVLTGHQQTTRTTTRPNLGTSTETEDDPDDRSHLSVTVGFGTYETLHIEIGGGLENTWSKKLPLKSLTSPLTVQLAYSEPPDECGRYATGTATVTLSRVP